MADLLREHDWESSPLGNPQDWSPSLRIAVKICLESTFPMTVLWGSDLVQLYNDAYLPLIGSKHPVSLARRCEDNWQEIWSTIGPLLNGVLERGEAVSFEDLELTIERRGSPEQAYFTFSYTPIREPDGSVGGVFCAASETTAPVRAQRRLALLHDLSKKATVDVQATAQDALETLGRATDDLSLVALSLRDEPSGRRVLVSRSLPAADLTKLRRAVAGARASGQPRWVHIARPPTIRASVIPLPANLPGQADVLVLGQQPAIRDDQPYRYFFHLVASQVETELGKARAWETEQRRGDTLAKLDRAKTAFFTNVSHEFQTPLMLIEAPLRETIEDPGLPAEHRARVEMARRASRRLRRLVNTLLEFSRMQAGASRPVPHNVDLLQTVTDVASAFRPTFDRAGLRLDIGHDGSAPRVRADPVMLERILLNLVSNAFKFTEHGGVRIVARSSGSNGIVEVIDTGVGIAPEDLDRIFDRFIRVNARWARSSEGIGVGLALAAELARAQGGSLEVESELDAGTAFRLLLPRALGPAGVATRDVLEREGYADEAAGWVQDELRLAAPDRETVTGDVPARPIAVDENAASRPTALSSAAAGGAWGGDRRSRGR